MELSNTNKLIQDLNTTESDDARLISSFQTLDKELKEGVKVASIPQDIASKLDTLDNDLAVVSDILTVLVVVPVVDEVAEPLSVAVKDMKKLVHPIRKKADAFAKKVAPVKKRISSAEQKVATVISDLQKLEKDATQFHDTLQTTETCVEKSGSADLAKALETFSGGVDPQVVTLNTALAAANTAASTMSKDLDSLVKACNVMKPVEAEIDKVIGVLSGISNTLGKIQSLLKEKISVPYGIKIKGKWYEPWKWHIKTVTFSFSIEDIFNGINTGISFVNDELMKLAKAAFHALHIKLPSLPSIPGLSAVEKAIDSAEAAVGRIADELTSIEKAILGIEKQLSAIEQAIKSFNVSCK
jgi:archaellum component FlaC